MNSAPLYTTEQIARLMTGIFSPGRDKRSPEYMAGCHAALTRWLAAGPATRNPHPAGSAAADAWWAGWDEGRSTAEIYQRRTYSAARDVVDAAVTGRWGLGQLQGQLEAAVKAVVPTNPAMPPRETPSDDGVEA